VGAAEQGRIPASLSCNKQYVYPQNPSIPGFLSGAGVALCPNASRAAPTFLETFASTGTPTEQRRSAMRDHRDLASTNIEDNVLGQVARRRVAILRFVRKPRGQERVFSSRLAAFLYTSGMSVVHHATAFISKQPFADAELGVVTICKTMVNLSRNYMETGKAKLAPTSLERVLPHAGLDRAGA
jgi:hypothetical protein